MGLKERLREKALELGFEDAGFTDAEPFTLYIQEVESRPPEMYRWAMRDDLHILRGASVREKHPWARSILVLLQNYHKRSFPPQLVGKIGRCYQVDERKERGEDHQRLMDYFAFLKKEEVGYQADGEIPARMSAARPGRSWNPGCRGKRAWSERKSNARWRVWRNKEGKTMIRFEDYANKHKHVRMERRNGILQISFHTGLPNLRSLRGE